LAQAILAQVLPHAAAGSVSSVDTCRCRYGHSIIPMTWIIFTCEIPGLPDAPYKVPYGDDETIQSICDKLATRVKHDKCCKVTELKDEEGVIIDINDVDTVGVMIKAKAHCHAVLEELDEEAVPAAEEEETVDPVEEDQTFKFKVTGTNPYLCHLIWTVAGEMSMQIFNEDTQERADWTGTMDKFGLVMLKREKSKATVTLYKENLVDGGKMFYKLESTKKPWIIQEFEKMG